MLLSQSRYWRAALSRDQAIVSLSVLRESLPGELELRELSIEVPLDKWNRVLRHVRSDRKLVGGVLLDFARQKDQVSIAIANDRLFGELQRVVVEATASLVECGALALVSVDVGAK